MARGVDGREGGRECFGALQHDGAAFGSNLTGRLGERSRG